MVGRLRNGEATAVGWRASVRRASGHKGCTTAGGSARSSFLRTRLFKREYCTEGRAEHGWCRRGLPQTGHAHGVTVRADRVFGDKAYRVLAEAGLELPCACAKQYNKQGRAGAEQQGGPWGGPETCTAPKLRSSVCKCKRACAGLVLFCGKKPPAEASCQARVSNEVNVSRFVSNSYRMMSAHAHLSMRARVCVSVGGCMGVS